MEKDNQDKRFRLIEVLTLSKPKWDCGKFVKEVSADPGLKGANVTVADQGVEIKSESGRYLAYVVPVDNPVPDGEAEEWARINYLWDGADKVARKHKAHVLVLMATEDEDVMSCAGDFVRIVCAALKQKCVTGVEMNDVLLSPEYYMKEAKSAFANGEVPLHNLVWIGVHADDTHMGFYTYGLRQLGKEEIEVYADADLGDIRAYVVMLALYVLSYDVTLRDGETIGFSEEQKLTIKLSEGIAIEGDTLKVEYDKDWMRG